MFLPSLIFAAGKKAVSSAKDSRLDLLPDVGHYSDTPKAHIKAFDAHGAQSTNVTRKGD